MPRIEEEQKPLTEIQQSILEKLKSAKPKGKVVVIVKGGERQDRDKLRTALNRTIEKSALLVSLVEKTTNENNQVKIIFKKEVTKELWLEVVEKIQNVWRLDRQEYNYSDLLLGKFTIAGKKVTVEIYPDRLPDDCTIKGFYHTLSIHIKRRSFGKVTTMLGKSKNTVDFNFKERELKKEKDWFDFVEQISEDLNSYDYERFLEKPALKDNYATIQLDKKTDTINFCKAFRQLMFPDEKEKITLSAISKKNQVQFRFVKESALALATWKSFTVDFLGRLGQPNIEAKRKKSKQELVINKEPSAISKEEAENPRQKIKANKMSQSFFSETVRETKKRKREATPVNVGLFSGGIVLRNRENNGTQKRRKYR